MFKNLFTTSKLSYAVREVPCDCGTPQRMFYLNVNGTATLIMTAHGEEDPAVVLSAATGRRALMQVQEYLAKEIPELGTLKLERQRPDEGMTLALDSKGGMYIRIQTEEGTVTQAIVADRLIEVLHEQRRIAVAGGDHRAVTKELQAWIKENVGLAASRWEFENRELKLIESVRDLLGENFSKLEALDWMVQLKIASQLRRANSMIERAKKSLQAGESARDQAIAAISDPSLLDRPSESNGMPQGLADMLASALGGASVQIVSL